ncbi:MAG: ketol-acid reductoisomerase [candidate division Zixibacteria bacterium]|nr:ketol-acid reductoisomerase [candidate division Zixibacteria bacterium]
MRVIRTASLKPITKKTIAVIGYGSQGRAQALNLRDAGIDPIIGLPSRSRSRRRAKTDGFTVTTTPRATRDADIILLLAPDHVHGVVFTSDIEPYLRDGQAIVVAHAASVHFETVTPPDNVDVIMVAPLGPGKRLRELRGERDGVSCFVAVHHDHSGDAMPLALALAKGIGCLPAGAIPTTFAHEAVGDLFGEQAVLCGGLGALLEAGVMTLIKHGFPPHAAYLECVYQLDLIIDLVKSEGLAGMYENISPTAAFGARRTGKRVISPAVRNAMDDVFADVDSGRFFRSWVRAGAQTTDRKQLAPTVAREFARGERDVLQQLGEEPASSD